MGYAPLDFFYKRIIILQKQYKDIMRKGPECFCLIIISKGKIIS